MLMQLANQENFIVHQMDVKTAYLNAPIDCEIYVEQQDGCKVTGRKGEKLVYELNKSLFGLKQSGRNWYTFLYSQLANEKLAQSLADSCVYTKNNNGTKVIIILWVDDLIIANSHMSTLYEVKSFLCRRFKTKDIGEIGWFLGIQFNRQRRKFK